MSLESTAFVLLRWQGDIVGSGKYVYKEGGRVPATILHGTELSSFEKKGEKLVAVRDVQIFKEFEDVHYPYQYGGIEEPPKTLGELNVVGQHFRSVIAWDDRNILLNPIGKELGTHPRRSSGRAVTNRTDLVSRSPRKVRFGPIVSKTEGDSSVSSEGQEVSAKKPEEGIPMSASPAHRTKEGSPMSVSPKQKLKAESPMSIETRLPRQRVSPMILTPAQRLAVHIRSGGLRSSMPISPAHLSTLRMRQKYSNSRQPQHDLSAMEDRASLASCRRRLDFSPQIMAESENDVGVVQRKPQGSIQSNLEGAQLTLKQMKIDDRKRAYRFMTRKKAAERTVSKLRQARLKLSKRPDNPFLKSVRCCRRECFGKVDPNYAIAQYREIMRMNRTERKLTLHELLDRRTRSFCFDGRVVCARFLSSGFGFSYCLQSTVKNTEGARASSSIVVIRRDAQQDRKKDRIISFLRNFAENAGEKLPHKAQISLPTLKKWQVYEKMLESLRTDRVVDVPSKNYFYTVWKENCAHIKTHRHHGFAVCGHCEFLRSQLDKHSTNIIAQHMFRASMRNHLKHVQEERLGYQDRQDRAIKYPEKYCSVVVDGADQKSYGLPHFAFNSKFDRGHKIKVRVIGVLEHKWKNHLTLFPMTEEFPTGANHVIEALHRVLQRKKDAEGKLPEVLFVQADNCSRENKNRYFMSYLEMLVARGVFVEVQVSFLPVGHTHSDIDQAFSTVAGALRVEDVVTMPDLLSLLHKCYGSRVFAEEMTRVANISGLLEFAGCLTKVKHFSSFRYFRFTRAEPSNNGKASSSLYRTACDVKVQVSDQWKPMTSASDTDVITSFLKHIPNMALTPPTKTKVPQNVSEVNKCIESSKQRLDANVQYKLESLWALRDRVYTMRIYNFHWDLTNCFEMNGNFSDHNYSALSTFGVRVQASDELEYEVGEFVAVKTAQDEDDPFWIAQVLAEAKAAESGEVHLDVHWYVPSQGSQDPYKASYSKATTLKNGTSVPYEEQIDVQSVLCTFEKLTAKNLLYVRTQKAIRDALGIC